MIRIVHLFGAVVAGVGALVLTSTTVASSSNSPDIRLDAQVLSVPPPPSGEHEIPPLMRAAEPLIKTLISRATDVPGYAGVWTNYDDGPRVIVGGTDPALLAGAISDVTDSLPVPLEVVRVAASLDHLLAAQESVSKTLGNESRLSGVAVREHRAALDIEVAADADIDRMDARLREARLAWPAIEMTIVRLPGGVAEPAVNFWGGKTVSGGGGGNCTSGFTIRRTTGGSFRGIVTAGHCASNGRVQDGVTLGNGFYNSCSPSLYADKQYHTIPSGHTATNRINISTSPFYRDINDWESSPYYFWVGRSIEKQGKSTGYRTGSIETSWYTANTTCGPGATQRVRATAATIGGDSGGPVFSGNEALGITSARDLSTGG